MAKYPNVRRCGNEPNKGKKQSKELDEGIRLAYGRVLGKAPAKLPNMDECLAKHRQNLAILRRKNDDYIQAEQEEQVKTYRCRRF